MDVKDISLGRVKDHPLSTSQLGTFKSSHKGGSRIKESRDSNYSQIKYLPASTETIATKPNKQQPKTYLLIFMFQNALVEKCVEQTRPS